MKIVCNFVEKKKLTHTKKSFFSLSLVFSCSTMGIEMADFASRELLFGLTTHESYLDLSAQDLEFGFNETRRDRILRTYVRNVYFYHLNEIYSALKVSFCINIMNAVTPKTEPVFVFRRI